jgi:hypothetical protein
MRELGAGCAQGSAGLIGAAASVGWRGPDPYDGLMAAWPSVLCAGPRRRQVIVQVHARAPIDVRRLYRRSAHPRIAKALALFGSAALNLLALEEDPVLRAQGLEALGLLAADHAAFPAWGYPFDVQTRWSFYPAGSPNVVVTSFAGRALGSAASVLGHDPFATRAAAAARWALEACFNAATGTFSYHEHSDTVIHNANLLGAQLVWSELRDEPHAREAVARAVERSLAAIRSDGLVPYGEGAGLEWADSFHTGFVLQSLVALRELDGSIDPILARVADRYRASFFGPSGEARLWPDRSYPEDAHSAGTALSALAALEPLGLVDRPFVSQIAERVLSSTLRNGRAVCRRGRFGSSRVHYLRWCDAHVAAGLADAARLLSGGAPAHDSDHGGGVQRTSGVSDR